MECVINTINNFALEMNAVLHNRNQPNNALIGIDFGPNQRKENSNAMNV